MSISFNADEIFEIAERIEINGARFYRKAAGIHKGTEAEKVLSGLAAMEEEHRIIFSAMRAELAEHEKEHTVYDPDDQVKSYLNAVADGHVFDIKTDPSELLKGDETLEWIFNKAIELEKDSIVFYLVMINMIPERLGRNKINNIIEEEERHVVQLSDQLEAL